MESMEWILLEVERPFVIGHLLLGFVDYYYLLGFLEMDRDIPVVVVLTVQS